VTGVQTCALPILLVPGQVVSEEIINFMTVLDVSEIHGYRADLGLRVFKEKVLDRHKITTSIGGMSIDKSKNN